MCLSLDQSYHHRWSYIDSCVWAWIRAIITVDHIWTRVPELGSELSSPLIIYGLVCLSLAQSYQHRWSHMDSCVWAWIRAIITVDHIWTRVSELGSERSSPLITYGLVFPSFAQSYHHRWSHMDSCARVWLRAIITVDHIWTRVSELGSELSSPLIIYRLVCLSLDQSYHHRWSHMDSCARAWLRAIITVDHIWTRVSELGSELSAPLITYGLVCLSLDQSYHHRWSYMDSCVWAWIRKIITVDHIWTRVPELCSELSSPLITYGLVCLSLAQSYHHRWSHMDSCVWAWIRAITTVDHIWTRVLVYRLLSDVCFRITRRTNLTYIWYLLILSSMRHFPVLVFFSFYSS